MIKKNEFCMKKTQETEENTPGYRSIATKLDEAGADISLFVHALDERIGEHVDF